MTNCITVCMFSKILPHGIQRVKSKEDHAVSKSLEEDIKLLMVTVNLGAKSSCSNMLQREQREKK